MITTHPAKNRTHNDHPSQQGGDPGWCNHVKHDQGERVTVFVRCGPHELTRTARWERVPAMARTLHLLLHRLADRDRHKRPRVSEQLSRMGMGIEEIVKGCQTIV
jgi:hypothetical protein